MVDFGSLIPRTIVLLVLTAGGCQPSSQTVVVPTSRSWQGHTPGARFGTDLDIEADELLVGAPGLREPIVAGTAWLLTLQDDDGVVNSETFHSVFPEFGSLAGSCVARLPDLDGDGTRDVGVCRARDGVLYGAPAPTAPVNGYATLEIPNNPEEAMRQFAVLSDGSVAASGWSGMVVFSQAPSGALTLGESESPGMTTYIETEFRPAFEILGGALVAVDEGVAFSAVGANHSSAGVLSVAGDPFETAVAWETDDSDPYAGDLELAAGDLNSDGSHELIVLDRTAPDRLWFIPKPMLGGTLSDADALRLTGARDVGITDMDGDGIQDLVVWTDREGDEPGGAAVFLGPLEETPRSIDHADYFLVAADVEDESGQFELGDLDGDGHGDIAFGTPEAGTNGEGRVTVVLSPL